MRNKLLLIIFLIYSTQSFSGEYSSECFDDPTRELSDIIHNSQTTTSISAQEVIELKKNWYSSAKDKNIINLQKMTTKNLIVGHIHYGKQPIYESRSEYFSNVSKWFNWDTEILSFKANNETVKFNKNRSFAIYEANIIENSKSPNGKLKLHIKEVSYVVKENGILKYAGICGKHTKLPKYR